MTVREKTQAKLAWHWERINTVPDTEWTERECLLVLSTTRYTHGILMGAPAFQYQRAVQFRKHQVSVFSSNFALYEDLSRRVMDTASRFMPDTGVYSMTRHACA